MVELRAYTPEYETDVLEGMADFFGFHHALLERYAGEGEGRNEPLGGELTLRDTLGEWTMEKSHLYILLFHETFAGFLRIGLRGDAAAWLEDIYVLPALRRKGIATQALGLAEERVRRLPGYAALCVDVAPRNQEALRLYQRLGYADLSLLTLRKELKQGEKKRDRALDVLGLRFFY